MRAQDGVPHGRLRATARAEVLEAIRAAGYRGVELCLERPDHAPQKMTAITRSTSLIFRMIRQVKRERLLTG